MSVYAEILMGGSGGQGLIFVSSFLAEAAMEAGLNAAQTQSYGIAQRGGYISSEVIISSEEILFQQVTTPNVIMALHDAVGSRFDEVTVPVVFDNELMHKQPGKTWVGLPFTRLATEMQVPKAANLIALGAALHCLPMLPMSAVEATACRKFAPEVAEANIRAVRCGFDAAAKAFAAKR